MTPSPQNEGLCSEAAFLWEKLYEGAVMITDLNIDIKHLCHPVQFEKKTCPVGFH